MESRGLGLSHNFFLSLMLLTLSLLFKMDDEDLLSHIVSHRLCNITLRLIRGKTFLNSFIDGSGIPYLYANISLVMSLRA